MCPVSEHAIGHKLCLVFRNKGDQASFIVHSALSDHRTAAEHNPSFFVYGGGDGSQSTAYADQPLGFS